MEIFSVKNKNKNKNVEKIEQQKEDIIPKVKSTTSIWICKWIQAVR